MLKQYNACIILDKIAELEKNVINLFNDINRMKKLKERSKKIAQKNFFDSKILIQLYQ